MSFLIEGVQALTWQQVVMYAVGILLIYLAIEKGYEPSLLLPMGFGAILVNLPFTGVLDQTLQGRHSGKWSDRMAVQCRDQCFRGYADPVVYRYRSND